MLEEIKLSMDQQDEADRSSVALFGVSDYGEGEFNQRT